MIWSHLSAIFSASIIYPIKCCLKYYFTSLMYWIMWLNDVHWNIKLTCFWFELKDIRSQFPQHIVKEHFTLTILIAYRLANSGESFQNVGHTRKCVDMKRMWASVHREARINMQYCAKELNDDGDIIKMKGFTSNRRWCLFRYQSQSQQSFRPAMDITTMLHIFYIAVFYLCFTINTNTFASAASTANNKQSHGSEIGVYAALSAADLIVSTTTEFGKYIKRLCI